MAVENSTPNNPPARWRWLVPLVAVGIAALDLGIKAIVERSIERTQQISLLGDILELRHVHNTGIAFGLLSDFAVPVVIVAAIVAVGIMMYVLRTEQYSHSMAIGGALVIGGALGNVIDRAVRGYVVDYIHLPRWPTFNLADIAIVVGVGFLLVAQHKAARRLTLEQKASEGVPGNVDSNDGNTSDAQ